MARPNSPGNPGNASERIVYLHTDHLDTPRKATDATGRVVWAWESDAFGSSAALDDPDGDGVRTVVNLRFPGQYFDQESGLHYNWHRYYDPLVGRYMQSDPIGLAGGMNTYVYVENQPTRYTDLDGLQARPRQPPPIPGDLGRYPYIPDPWRKDYYRDYREGHYKSICVERSCPFDNPPSCTPSNPAGQPTTWSGGPFLSAPGSSPTTGCTCKRYVLEWFPGWDTPNLVRNLSGG